MKVQDLLVTADNRLVRLSDTPQLDAQVLLAHVIQKPRTWVSAHPEHEIKEEERHQFDCAIEKLEEGDPLPYVLGKWEFFGLELDITKDVLIPRPETELLVEKAIIWLQNHPEQKTIADIGTGSGAIAISIATHIPDARILATDISPSALQIAKQNAKKFNVQNRVKFIECDLLPTLDVEHSTFNLICSNPPYIPTKTLRNLPIFGREPTIALDGGADGLDIYRRLFQLAPDRLSPNGMMLLEIESTLGMQILSLAYDSFFEASIHLHRDLAGHDRLLEVKLP